MTKSAIIISAVVAFIALVITLIVIVVRRNTGSGNETGDNNNDSGNNNNNNDSGDSNNNSGNNNNNNNTVTEGNNNNDSLTGDSDSDRAETSYTLRIEQTLNKLVNLKQITATIDGAPVEFTSPRFPGGYLTGSGAGTKYMASNCFDSNTSEICHSQNVGPDARLLADFSAPPGDLVVSIQNRLDGYGDRITGAKVRVTTGGDDTSGSGEDLRGMVQTVTMTDPSETETFEYTLPHGDSDYVDTGGGDSGDSDGSGGGDGAVSLASCADAGGENSKNIPDTYNLDNAYAAGGGNIDGRGYLLDMDDNPILIPMQCAELCTLTEDCWGYTFIHGYNNVAKCYLKKVPPNGESYDTVKQDSSHLHYSGVKCQPPTYTTTLSNNYYTQRALHAHQSLMNSATISPIEEFTVYTWQNGYGGMVLSSVVNETDAIDSCQAVCNGYDAYPRICKGYQLTMISPSSNVSDNYWHCRLYSQDFVAFGEVKSSSTTCAVNTTSPAGTDLPADIDDCAHLGLRLYETA